MMFKLYVSQHHSENYKRCIDPTTYERKQVNWQSSVTVHKWTETLKAAFISLPLFLSDQQRLAYKQVFPYNAL